MHCTKCGAELTGNTRFCTKCGAPVATVQAAGVTPTAGVAPTMGAAPAAKADVKSMLKNPKAKIIIVAAAVVILAVILIASFAGRRSWKKTLDIFTDFASGRGSAESMMSIIPEEFIKAVAQDEGMTRKEMEAELRDEMEEVREDLEYEFGPNYKVVFDVVDTYEYSKAELRMLNEELYYGYGFSKKNTAKAAMEAKVEMACAGDGETYSGTEDITLIKIGRKWYISPTLGGF